MDHFCSFKLLIVTEYLILHSGGILNREFRLIINTEAPKLVVGIEFMCIAARLVHEKFSQLVSDPYSAWRVIDDTLILLGVLLRMELHTINRKLLTLNCGYKSGL